MLGSRAGRRSPRPWSTSGAEVIKVEPPAGDYIREMTWPIVEGTSLMHLHLNRGKRSLVLDLRTEAGVAILKELAASPTPWSRPCVRARWPGAASGSTTCAP